MSVASHWFTWNEESWPKFQIAWGVPWTTRRDHDHFDTGNIHIGCKQRRTFYFMWRRRRSDKRNFFLYGQVLKCEGRFDGLILYEDRDPIERDRDLKPIPRSGKVVKA